MLFYLMSHIHTEELNIHVDNTPLIVDMYSYLPALLTASPPLWYATENREQVQT